MSAEPDAKLVGQYRGAGTLSSPFIVSFEEGDPDNPYEWGNKMYVHPSVLRQTRKAQGAFAKCSRRLRAT